MSVFNRVLNHAENAGSPLMFYNYHYDQLNRLTYMDAYNKSSLVVNNWAGINVINYFKERIAYDDNGNILKYSRYGYKSSNYVMDSLSYTYNSGTNQLNWVKDPVPASRYGNDAGDIPDIDSQPVDNYGYDEIGNLIKDSAEGITGIQWSVYGKILEINKTGEVHRISYTYDAQGNRISKTVLKNTGNKTYTWYVRDAQGNVMGTYSSQGNPEDLSALPLYLSERDLYGSSRLGVYSGTVNVDGGPKDMSDSNSTKYYRGLRQYELTNHLGNVLATVSDKKKGTDTNGDGQVDYYDAEVITAQDYYPFGMLMGGRVGYQTSAGWTSEPGTPAQDNSLPADIAIESRTGNEPPEYTATRSVELQAGFESGSGDAFLAYISQDDGSGGDTGEGGGSGSSLNGAYRYGFNGKEMDNEVKGNGNQLDYGMRIYDPRLGRFLSVDPISKDYPELTPYQFASNTPIQAIDLDGLEAFYVHGTWSSPNTFSKLSISTIDNITKNTQGPVFRWSGNNTDRARRLAAEQLAQHVILNRDLNQPLTLVGHSHGGNVAIMAANILSKKGIKVDNLITINTPIREYSVNADAVKTHVNISQKLDPIQAGGGDAINIPDGALLIPSPGFPIIIPIREGTKQGTGEIGPAGRRVNGAYNILVPFDKNNIHNTHNTPDVWKDALNNLINPPKIELPKLPKLELESNPADNTQVVQPFKDKIK